MSHSGDTLKKMSFQFNNMKVFIRVKKIPDSTKKSGFRYETKELESFREFNVQDYKIGIFQGSKGKNIRLTNMRKMKRS